MLRRVPAFAALLVLFAGFLGCSPKESALIVHVSGWTAKDMHSLRILTTIGSAAGITSTLSPFPSEFRVLVPSGAADTLILEAMVKGPDNCYLAGHVVRVPLSTDIQVRHIDLDLRRYSNKACAKVCSPNHWCWENPLPQGNNLYGVWSDRPDNAWAVGRKGTVLRWDGEQWVSIGIDEEGQDFLWSTWGPNGSEVWVVGDKGVIRRWDGAEWRTRNDLVSGGSSLRAVWGTREEDAWAVGENGTILHWQGDKWLPDPSMQDLQPTMTTLLGIWGSGPDDLWVVGARGTILRRKNSLWTVLASSSVNTITSNDLYGVWGRGSDEVFVVGNVQTLLRWDGSSWNNMSNSLPAGHLRAIWGDSESIWVTGTSGAYLRSTDGRSWERFAGPPGAAENYSLGASRSNDAWAVGGRGMMVHWDGSGWSPHNVPGPRNALHAIWGSSGGEIGAVGSQELIVKRELLPQEAQGPWKIRWQQKRSPTTGPTLRSISGTGPDLAWAVGDNGRIYRGTNKLSAWGRYDDYPGTEHAYGVWSFADNYVWIVGENGTNRLWDGRGWGGPFAYPPLPPTSIRAVWGLSHTAVWAVGDGGKIGFWNGAWSSSSPGSTAQLNAIWGSRKDYVWVVGSNGKALLWKEGWKDIPTGTMANLNSVWGAADDSVWAVGQDGVIMKWEGATWAPQRSGTSVELRGIWGADANNVWAVGDDGVILHYEWNN